ncbi:opacity protein-like surface antigen [Flavobacterium sp. CG_9.10]|uniref:outer membrane beta-barrel protein n=1 Tax=Flavobacterium sp. CG_9.10 TaxID=2787729 RepID=UPI0018C95310|nr:outer membrane beta-barrel protein [Flavobacterium sp. CG_9.10]MBG6109315.1 opacity protein-like surface antigen [Flavobacterium sp. CG_9.10]
MKKNLLLLGFMACSLTMMGQTDKKESKKESWYFKLGASYFTQATATEFPTVGGRAANKDVYVGGKLNSRESVTGSFGEGFRYGGNVGYRFTDRLGVEMGINYYNSNSKTMVQTISQNTTVLKSDGQVKALDLAPALVLFLGEVKGFETYSKVGVIVPVNGTLTIKTDAIVPTSATTTVAVQSVDKVKPNPTVGFMAALGTSYKLGKNLSAFGEVEYRNFTVHGKTKETTEFTMNGADAMATRTQSDIHTNYSNQINSTSNNMSTNAAGFDKNKPTDDLSSYISISGVGLTLGLKYSL